MNTRTPEQHIDDARRKTGKTDVGVPPEVWGTPTGLEAIEPFPVDALPDPMRAMVEAVAVFTQTPPDLGAAVAFGVASAALARRVLIEIRSGWTEPAMFYIAALADPGDRKTAVVNAIAGGLRVWEREAQEAARNDVAVAAVNVKVLEKRLANATDALVKAKSEADRMVAQSEAHELAVQLENVDRPVEPRLLVDDVTPEKLGTLLSDHHRLAALSDEGGLFDLLAGRYNSMPNLDVVLKGYDGSDIRVDRQGRKSEHIENPALTLMFAIQAEVLRALGEHPAFRGRGFLGRFAFMLPESLVGSRVDVDELDPIPPRVLGAWNMRTRELLEMVPGSSNGNGPAPIVLQLTPEAAHKHRQFRVALEPRLARDGGDLSAMSDWAAKHSGRVARMALLLHFIQHGRDGAAHPVSGGTMDSACRIGTYMVGHACRALSLASRDDADLEQARAALRWIERSGKTSFKAREIGQARKGSRDLPDMPSVEASLRMLESLDYVRCRPSARPAGSSGRPPSPTFDVNPAAFKRGGAR